MVTRKATGTLGTCWAYTEEGTICGKSAVAVDPQRGCAVCEEHAKGGEHIGKVKD